MNIRRYFCSLLLLICLCVSVLTLLPGQTSFARTVVPTRTQNTRMAAASSAHVTIIILDMSGSMAQNDPDKIRCSAANAYIDLSNPGDVIGAVKLDGSPTDPYTPLLRLTRVKADNKTALKQELASNTDNCKPDSTTPTYSALDEALRMLEDPSNNGLSGSAILLTDGLPDPGGDTEVQRIEHDLVPKFLGHGWPIDTIALGEAANSTFLDYIANHSGGTPYKDTDGEVPGTSALNVMPFFVQIFAARNHENLESTIPVTNLPYASSFSVGEYADHYDLIVMKEDASANIGLRDPNGGSISAKTVGSGQFYSGDDPHYVIYETKTPPQGAWQINANGTGHMLANSLIIPSLVATIVKPAVGTILPFDKPFAVTAELTSHGITIPGSGYDLSGQWLYDKQVVGKFDLPKNPDTNQFMNTGVSLDSNNALQPGTYMLQIQVRGTGGGDPINTSSQTYVFDYLPVASFMAADGSAARGALHQSVVRWPGVLQFVYTHLTVVPWLSQVGQLALQGPPALPPTRFYGKVEEGGQLYSRAQITASATLVGSQGSLAVPIVNDTRRPGYFYADFSQIPEGIYRVTLISYGRLGGITDYLTSVQIIQLTVLTVPPGPLGLAFAVTFAYLALWLLVLSYFIMALFYPFVRARPLKYSIGPEGRSRPVNNKISLLKRLRHPKLVFFKPERGDGLELRVQHGVIAARRPGKNVPHKKLYWFKLDQSPLDYTFREVQAVIYSPNNQPNDPQAKTYRFSSPEAGGNRPQRPNRPGGGTRPGGSTQKTPNRKYQI